MPLSPQRVEGDSLESYLRSIRATHEQMDRGKSWSGRERNCAYLNLGDGEFGNISAVSGLDFLDDARGMAYVDWDHDGDLDIWLSNRTGPRLRLMRNVAAAGGRYVALRLRGDGEGTNSDAVGARVSLGLDDGTKLIRTLRAGEGFLSQSSKWLHFGLGDGRVESVEVRWPGGGRESIAGVSRGGHFVVVQGSRSATPWVRPGEVEIDLEAKPVKPREGSLAARVVLPSRLPVPSLSKRRFGEEEATGVEIGRRPTLINFWASWCVPCRTELAEFKAGAGRLREAGVDVVALATDGLVETIETTEADALSASRAMALPFEVAMATAETLDKLEQVRRFLFDRQLPFSLPVSYLIDADGQLAVIYRGGVSVETLVGDVAALGQEPAARRDASVPLRGRWYTQPSEVNPRAFAKWFEEPFPDEAARLLDLNIRQRAAALEVAGASEQERGWATFELVESHRRLAVIRSGDQRHAEAAEHCRAGLGFEPGDPHLRYLLVQSLRSSGAKAELREQLAAWVGEDPDDNQARLRLAEFELGEGRFAEAARLLERAVELAPEDVYGRVQYGLALAQKGAVEEAAAQFSAALTFQPDHREALLNLAAAHEKLGRAAEGISVYSKVIELTPDSPYANYKVARLEASLGKHEAAIRSFQATLAIRPGAAGVHEDLGLSLLAVGRSAEAVASFRKAFELDPRRVGAANNAAWILATHAGGEVRNEALALQIATKINVLTKHGNPSLLDTLAVAQASAGKFDQAVATAKRAIGLAEQVGATEAAGSMRGRLDLFLQGKPFREKSSPE